MRNPKLANRYAKSLMDIAVEENKVSAVYEDIKYIIQICKLCPDFVKMLRSPIIKPDKKQAILEAVIGDKINGLTLLFLRLLIKKSREANLPEMAKAFEEQYNVINNIHRVVLTSATPLDSALQEQIVSKIKSDKQLSNIELETKIDESLIGGFKIQLGDLLVDASISHDLKHIKRQFLNNDYIHKLR